MQAYAVHPLKSFIVNFISAKGVDEKTYCESQGINSARCNKTKNGHWLLTQSFAEDLSKAFNISKVELYKMEIQYLKERALVMESLVSRMETKQAV